MGGYRMALTPQREAIDLLRPLATNQPARYTDDLATSLNNLGNQLNAVGAHDEALTCRAEAVAWRARLAPHSDDDDDDDDDEKVYREARAALARSFATRGHSIEDAHRAERDAARRLPPPRDLSGDPPDPP